MSPQGLIDKYYPEANELRHILLTHSRSVADKALWIADRHPELSLDRDFLYEAAMLHDIGIFLTDADGIYCFGDKPYICHGYLGADLVRSEGYPRHALVCERHTGAGLALEDIIAQNLPVPHRDMLPVSNKNANFAAGCSREVIQRGTDMLGWELSDLIQRTILAMRECEEAYEAIG